MSPSWLTVPVLLGVACGSERPRRSRRAREQRGGHGGCAGHGTHAGDHQPGAFNGG